MFALSLASSVVAAFHSHSPTSPLLIYSVNANGAIGAYKMDALRSAILARQPHVFVVCETKTAKRVSNSLPHSEYFIYEEPGVPSDNFHTFKWGIVVGIRRDVQHDPPLPTPPPLRGRAIAIDLTLRAVPNAGFRHRVMGVYAPYEPWFDRPGQDRRGAVTDDFWTAVERWCHEAPDGSWSMAGDCNATLFPFESVSARHQGDNRFRHFLRNTGGRDLWSHVDDRTPAQDWTCYSSTKDEGASIIDRAIVSRIGVADAQVEAARHFRDRIPSTNHRPIIATIIPVPPFSLHAHSDLSPVQPVPAPPRLCYPSKKEKHRFNTFAEEVDAALKDSPSLASLTDYTQIGNDDLWTTAYQELTRIMYSAGKKAFGFYAKRALHSRPSERPREAILKYYEMKLIGGALRLLGDDAATVSIGARDYLRSFTASVVPSSSEALRELLVKKRRTLGKQAYKICEAHARKRAEDTDRRKMLSVLHGVSSKRAFNLTCFEGLPTVVLKPDDANTLVSDPDAVKEAHCEYFANLYKRSAPPAVARPWMSTPSVVEVRRRVERDPFVWPRIATIQSFRAMLQRGNARPSPGPDGWEKWCVRALSDAALTRVIALHNYEVVHSRVPDSVKDTRITSLHKRGLMADLRNKRGIGISNFLHNSPAAFLNFYLAPYAARLGIIPQTQVAAQQGVQTRDLTSFLAGVQCWAFRHRATVYALQRDQMKGFDYLAPEGFYDAVRAYGLPEAIIKLDKSAQAHNRCFIRTAYGFTEPIVVDGVTKQGASLSPTKSTFTTSLGHRYINDLCIGRPGVLEIRTKAAELSDPHTPADELALTVTMVEATDDSYIFATELDTLDFICLTLERFQFVYGWLTQWKKSRGYIIGAVPTNPPTTFRLGSVTTDPGSNPMTVTRREVAVVTDGLYFMNTKINDSSARADLVRSIIDNFSLPAFAVRPPLTVIRRAFEQQAMSKIRALLTMQPVSAAEAKALDARVTSRIHHLMNFRYCPSSSVLSLPVGLHGLGWTSISRLNAALAVEGLARDLNHHVPAYRVMANITLADWTCERNDCVYPFDAVGLKRVIHPNSKNSLPIAWIVAHETMRTSRPCLHLRRTDMSHILDGRLSVAHALKVAKAALPETAAVNATALGVLRRRGIQQLADCGRWTVQGNRVQFNPWPQYPRVRRGAADPGPVRWLELVHALTGLPITALFEGTQDLLIPRDERRQQAEGYIRAVARVESMHPATVPQLGRQTLWATDGSMVPATAARHQDRSVTAAVTGPATMVLKVTSRAASILHGEVMALVAASILSGDARHTVLSDHQNSVRLLQDPSFLAGDDHRIRRANGRSYYRWLQRVAAADRLPVVTYTRGHADSDEVESRFNTLADYYATSAQEPQWTVPDAPVPTFTMDSFTFYSDDDGWIESNIRAHVTHYSALQTAQDLGGKYRMATRLYDTRAPPDYPYLKAYRAYSAIVQLYARSGQLPTAARIAERHDFDAGLQSEACRMECGHTFETEYHIFVECPAFDTMRVEAGLGLRRRISRMTDMDKLDDVHQQRIMELAEFFYSSDRGIWPLKMSQFWYGHVPILDEFVPEGVFASALTRRQFVHKIFTEWHYASIRLAGRIWGEFATRTAKRYSNTGNVPDRG